MWSNKRTAGTQLGWAGLPAVLFLFTLVALLLPGAVLGEDGNEVEAAKFRAALDINGALEINFFGQKGNVYTVEGQVADGSWSELQGPIYGRNRRVKTFFDAGGAYLDFRLDVQSLADLGDAPSQLIGHQYSLNYGTKLIGLRFDSETAGSAEDAGGNDRPFAYSYEKTQEDIGLLVMDFGGAQGTETLALEFERGRVGVFSSKLSRPQRRDLKSAGTFRAGADVSAVPPASLIGSRFVFRDRGMTSVLTLTTNFSGSLSRQGGDTEVISYTYDVSSWPEAFLNVELTTTVERHAYELSFNGRNSGIFVRRKIVNGRVKDTDRGKFSGKGAGDPDDDGKGDGNSEADCLAPDSLAGHTLQARLGSRVVTILLNGAGTGSILKRLPDGRLALEPFTYSYSKESCTEGLLTITTPTGAGDEVQLIELDFTSESGGTCVRKRFEDGTLDDTQEGTFTLSEGDDDLVYHEGNGGNADD